MANLLHGFGGPWRRERAPTHRYSARDLIAATTPIRGRGCVMLRIPPFTPGKVRGGNEAVVEENRGFLRDDRDGF